MVAVPKFQELLQYPVGSKEEGKHNDRVGVIDIYVSLLEEEKFFEIYLQMWVQAYRVGQQLYDNTNNGIEAQNKTFKYSFLNCCRNMSMSRLIYLLVQVFVPAQMAK